MENEKEDKAEAKAGIAEFKGRIVHAQIFNVDQKLMKPKEESTKLDNNLKSMKKFLDAEKEERLKRKDKEYLLRPIVDSEDESEHHDDGTEVFVPLQTEKPEVKP